MGNSEAAGNIERFNGRIEANKTLIQEANNVISDIKVGKSQSERAGNLANLLAEAGDGVFD
jgi:hypothetical protein